MDDRYVRWAFETHAPSLHRFATRLTADPDLAEDLVQEAFIRLADAEGIENEKAWLFRVTSNLATNANRSTGRRRGLLRLMGHRQPIGEPAILPDEAFERQEIRSLVHRAMREMPERDRMLLLMREEGFTQAEIADAIGSTTKSIGTLLARALIKVRSTLEEVQEALT